MIKCPEMVLPTMQDAINVGLNAFALQLVAESFSDDPAKFGDKTVLVRMEDHNHHEVWMVLTKTAPKPEDFAPAL